MRAPKLDIPHFHIPRFHMPNFRARPGDYRVSTADIWLWAFVGLAFVGALYVAFNSASYYADLLAAGPVYTTP